MIITDGQHDVFVSRLGALYKAPLPLSYFQDHHQPFRVLDIGCGTGIWTRSFALAHPSCLVTGIDLLPPSERLVPDGLRDFPPNCSFVKGNFEQSWTFKGSEERFDFIYARMLMAGINDWQGLFRRCYDRLRPGGYFEVFEGLMEMKAEDGAGPEISPAIRWFQLAQQYLGTVGLRWNVALDLPDYLRKAGFTMVQDTPVKMRLSPGVRIPENEKEPLADQYLRNMCDMVENMTSEAVQDMKTMRQKRGFHTTLYVRVAQRPTSEQ
ncbi:MAG: hypothetical protein Q9170_005333 [Blastenia crenularia]